MLPFLLDAVTTYLLDVVHHVEGTAFPHFPLDEAESESFGHGHHREKTVFRDRTLRTVIPRHLVGGEFIDVIYTLIQKDNGEMGSGTQKKTRKET